MLGALQGFLLSVFLFTHTKRKKPANKVLAWLILMFSVNLLVPELTRNFHKELPHLISASDSLLYLFGPLIYLYTLLLTGRSNTLSKKDLLHFIPFLLGTLVMLPFFLQPADAKLAYIEDVKINGLPPVFLIGWSLECLHIAVYMIFSIRVITKYKRRIKESFSNLDKINLQWLYYVLTGNLAIWTLYSAILITYLFGTPFESFNLISHLFGYLSAVFIYLIGYRAIKQPEVFTQMVVNTAGDTKSPSKYHRSGLTDLKAEEYKGLLLTFMGDESPHLNPDLTLTDLSEALSVPNNHLSQVINEKFNQNFFDFINSYRVTESQAWLKDPVRSKATMLEIAFESGFKSKSTFNAAFKKHTQQTPSEYKKEQTQLSRTA
ncbi:MAG: AraC family transcriptional regulator [Roseivirga sp.]|nr:AraC family transcriptional regulator [Roseivirga sp.]